MFPERKAGSEGNQINSRTEASPFARIMGDLREAARQSYPPRVMIRTCLPAIWIASRYPSHFTSKNQSALAAGLLARRARQDSTRPGLGSVKRSRSTFCRRLSGPLSVSPPSPDADETPVGQRVPADMIRQDRDAQPVDGGMANGHHIGAAHPRHHAHGAAAAVFVLQLPFKILRIVSGREGRQLRQLLDIRDLARQPRRGDEAPGQRDDRLRA